MFIVPTAQVDPLIVVRFSGRRRDALAQFIQALGPQSRAAILVVPSTPAEAKAAAGVLNGLDPAEVGLSIDLVQTDAPLAAGSVTISLGPCLLSQSQGRITVSSPEDSPSAEVALSQRFGSMSAEQLAASNLVLLGGLSAAELPHARLISGYGHVCLQTGTFRPGEVRQAFQALADDLGSPSDLGEGVSKRLDSAPLQLGVVRVTEAHIAEALVCVARWTGHDFSAYKRTIDPRIDRTRAPGISRSRSPTR
ncbi:MAG: hypothetical protein ACI9WU_001159 [Myxococcota bacterium]|jgi:hypothetical protein